MSVKIAVSIINYRTADMTLNCVESVLEDAKGIDLQIVVVDNNSQDGSVEKIADWLATQPKECPVTLVRSNENNGFSSGHNLGMGSVEAQWYLVLNSDAILRPGFLETILTTASDHPDAGVIVPKLEGEDGSIQPNCFRFIGPMSELIRSANTGFVTRVLQSYEVSLGSEPDMTQTDWASFACILLKGEMVKALGPMDEGYFLYFEDAEYCLRAKQADWRVVRAAQAVAVHYRGGSGPVKSLAAAKKRLPAYYYESRTRFLYQAHGRIGLIAANLLWYMGRCIAQARRLAGRTPYPMPEAESRNIWRNAITPLRTD
ncbi:MAG: glycosyltransferase family 2 protein [Tateyamaria sp.]|uniref:glycosyltransferase family 2 protein n=1 Tax=Alphaproteobacteria TaxID=28211 RepID=UPI0032985940